MERATLRIETELGRQLQVDFGECCLEVAGERPAKAVTCSFT